MVDTDKKTVFYFDPDTLVLKWNSAKRFSRFAIIPPRIDPESRSYTLQLPPNDGGQLCGMYNLSDWLRAYIWSRILLYPNATWHQNPMSFKIVMATLVLKGDFLTKSAGICTSRSFTDFLEKNIEHSVCEQDSCTIVVDPRHELLKDRCSIKEHSVQEIITTPIIPIILPEETLSEDLDKKELLLQNSSPTPTSTVTEDKTITNGHSDVSDSPKPAVKKESENKMNGEGNESKQASVEVAPQCTNGGRKLNIPAVTGAQNFMLTLGTLDSHGKLNKIGYTCHIPAMSQEGTTIVENWPVSIGPLSEGEPREGVEYRLDVHVFIGTYTMPRIMNSFSYSAEKISELFGVPVVKATDSPTVTDRTPVEAVSETVPTPVKVTESAKVEPVAKPEQAPKGLMYKDDIDDLVNWLRHVGSFIKSGKFTKAREVLDKFMDEVERLNKKYADPELTKVSDIGHQLSAQIALGEAKKVEEARIKANKVKEDKKVTATLPQAEQSTQQTTETTEGVGEAVAREVAEETASTKTSEQAKLEEQWINPEPQAKDTPAVPPPIPAQVIDIEAVVERAVSEATKDMKSSREALNAALQAVKDREERDQAKAQAEKQHSAPTGNNKWWLVALLVGLVIGGLLALLAMQKLQGSHESLPNVPPVVTDTNNVPSGTSPTTTQITNTVPSVPSTHWTGVSGNSNTVSGIIVDHIGQGIVGGKNNKIENSFNTNVYNITIHTNVLLQAPAHYEVPQHDQHGKKGVSLNSRICDPESGEIHIMQPGETLEFHYVANSHVIIECLADRADIIYQLRGLDGEWSTVREPNSYGTRGTGFRATLSERARNTAELQVTKVRNS